MRYLVVTTPFFILALAVVSSYRETDGGCYFSPEKDAVPKVAGDIYAEIGSSASVRCMVFDNSSYTADNLTWVDGKGHSLAGRTELIDRKTIQLNFANLSLEDNGFYRCRIKAASMPVKGNCLATVRVGPKPIKPENFTCLSHNWEYMDCTWDVPKNRIPTDYSLVVVFLHKHKSDNCTITRRFSQTYGCNFSASSNVIYDIYKKNYNFQMTGNNTLGVSTWNFSVGHFSRVKPNAPRILKYTSDTSRAITVVWAPPEAMKRFPPGLTYRVESFSQWMPFGNQEVKEPYNLTAITLEGLQPFTNYTVSISGLSAAANRLDKSMWSPSATVSVTTLADVPDSPPKVTQGCFSSIADTGRRKVVIYWQAIPEYQRNGPDFVYYVVGSALNGNVDTRIFPSEVTEGFAVFPNLSQSTTYLFYLASRNRVNVSDQTSQVVVPAKSKMLPRTESLMIVAYNKTFYEVTWTPPSDMRGVTGFTVFYTGSNIQFEKNVEGALSWKTARLEETSLNLTVPERWPYYHFGIAVNGPETSSDITWNTCIIAHNGTIAKLKRVSIVHTSSTNMTVRWSIDCAEKLGVITGYSIYYCMVPSSGSEFCISEWTELFVRGVNVESAVIDDLLPYSWYRVTVTAVTRMGKGEFSDSLYQRTREAAPEDAATNIQIPEATNTSFLIVWHRPSTPNGAIRKYIIEWRTAVSWFKTEYQVADVETTPETTYMLNVTENVQPYTNYSVTLKACNVAQCSKESKPVTVMTEVGIPGQMDPPLARLVNLTHAVVQPEMRDDLNGPILHWQLKMTIVSSSNDTLDETIYTNLTDELAYIPIDCGGVENEDRAFLLQSRAVNSKDGQPLIGSWSDYSKLSCLLPAFPIGTIVAVVVGATFGLTILLIVAIYATRWVKKIYIECSDIKVIVPSGIESVGEYNDFKRAHKQQQKYHPYSKSEFIHGASPNTRLLNEEPRLRNASGETTQSGSSTEELLLQEQKSRNVWGNDSIASANQDTVSSRPSTAQTQLSSDSSMELTQSVPESPDSVFSVIANGEHPLKNNSTTAAATLSPSMTQQVQCNGAGVVFNPTLTPIGESQDGTSSLSGTPQHYAKFAGYAKGNSPAGSPSKGYVAAPYSKFGAVASPPSYQDELPVVEFAGRFKTGAGSPSAPAPSYSKFGMSLPTFEEPPVLWKPGPDAPDLGPLTSTPTRSSVGYSVMGLTDENVPTVGTASVNGFVSPTFNKGYVVAASLNGGDVAEDGDDRMPSPLASTSKYDDASYQELSPASPLPGDYVNAEAHKRSPSNASSLMAGYCRFGLSRPTSTCSESGPPYTPTDVSVGLSPSKSSSCRTSMDAGSISPSYHSIPPFDSPVRADSSQRLQPTSSCSTPTESPMAVNGSSGSELRSPTGYATMQQLLNSEGNS